jgi:hypothetical protein
VFYHPKNSIISPAATDQRVTRSSIGSTNGAIGADYSAFTADESNVEAGAQAVQIAMSLPQVALEVLACKKALDALKKSPTWTNNIVAAAACTKAFEDSIVALGAWGQQNPDFVRAMTAKPVP